VSWTTTDAVDEFLAEAGEFLNAEPARNTVILSVTESLKAGAAETEGAAETGGGGGLLFGWWRAGPGPVSGAFMQTYDFPAFLTSMTSEAAAELAAELAAAGHKVPGVNAERQAAEAFEAAWRQRTGDAATVHAHMRLYRLGRLTPPEPPPDGAPRVAGDQDRDLLIEWFEAFAREVDDPPGQDQAAAVDDRLGYGGVTVWEAAGAPVSLAGVTRVTRGMARVAPVYTPPPLRGRGYAGAVTAVVSQGALDAGATEVVLYTDLANPTSNSLYQRLGYRAVEDRLALYFRPSALRWRGERS
jgi:predicted GNAT family acetyltransferase